ncbi:hypothetical protein [Nakamurella lactea]|uniref:hypothetical protein n=1 Tax=Nakamurella lactea TaxID=459515 RepID=UPI00048C635D|nr:hypothetical protein [Nakamurella lactea]
MDRLPDDHPDIVDCPDCVLPAEVLWRADLPSTDGPVPHVKIRCLARHWFLLPVAQLRGPRPGPARYQGA